MRNKRQKLQGGGRFHCNIAVKRFQKMNSKEHTSPNGKIWKISTIMKMTMSTFKVHANSNLVQEYKFLPKLTNEEGSFI